MGRSDSDLIKNLSRDSRREMMLIRIILCSILLAVVLSAEETEEKSLLELKRDIRAAEGSRREDGRRKKNAIKKRGRKNRKTRDRRRQRLNRKKNDGERKRFNAKKKNPARQKGNGNDRNRKSRVGVRTSNSSSGLNETCFSQAIFF